MYENLKLLLIKFNFFYPYILGYKYFKYKKYRIKNNFFKFNSEGDLFQIIKNSVLTIPYYKNRYCLKNINSLNDFVFNFEFIDKDIVMNNWEDFQLPGNYQSKIVTGTTGGTSGKPLKLVLPKNRYVFELATMYSMWENIGWHGQTRAVIRNAHLSGNQSFKVDILKKEVIFDGFRTSKDYYYTIYNTIKNHNISFIHAYPSSAYQFSLFLKKENLDVSFIKGFFCGSEALLAEQKQLIQNDLGLSIYHWYGHSEKLVLGGYCKGSDLIHIEPTYGYFELIDDKDEPIKEVGKVGEIVGTTLHNPYMPLIRYRTGDFAEYAGDYCKHCNRYLTLLKNIQGRWDKNKIYLKDGSYVTTTALNLHSDLYLHIDGIQYVQKEKGELDIYLVKGDNFSETIEKELKTHFDNSFLGKCNYQFIYKGKLEKETNGKFLPLKQYIKD
jgi:phenylacetate-CoA ligase